MSNPRFRKIFLIVNQFAGHREKVKKEVSDVSSYLQNRGCEVIYCFTRYPGHATQLATDAVKNGFELIVAVGGDGTVNEVARGLIGTTAILGIIPAGSGNGLAREMGIPMNCIKSAQTLLNGTVRKVDICKMNNLHFFCTCGIGFDAQVALKMEKSSHRKFFRYIQLTIREYFHFKPFKIEMSIDGKLIRKPVFMVTFANASQFGNNAFIAPDASINDGLIDVIVVHPFYKIWMPVFCVGLFAKIVPKLPFIDCYRAKKIEITNSGTNRIHYDGEPAVLPIPARIEITGDQLNIMAKKAK